MNQKLSDWASIAEIVSGVAIVVTLIVLILQVQGNTDELRAASQTTISGRIQAVVLATIENPHVSEVIVRDALGEELSPSDEFLVSQVLVLALKLAEEAHIAHRDGRIEEEILRTRMSFALNFFANERMRERWANRRYSGNWVPGFVEEFDAALLERNRQPDTRSYIDEILPTEQ